jgi:hypothetical protein
MKVVRLIKMCSNEMYSKVHIGKRFLDTFPIQNGLQQENASLPLFFNLALEYTIRKVQENEVAPKLNGTCQLLVNADSATILGEKHGH